MHPSVLGKINPFLGACNGMRSPDNFGYPTGTAVARSAFLLPTTNATGYAAAFYTPFANTGQYAPGSVAAGGTITWAVGTTSAIAQAAALNNISSTYRTVAWGLRITTDQALTAAQGHIWVAQVPINHKTTWPYDGAPTTEAQIAAMPLAEKFSLVELAERPLIVPGRAFDDGVYRFRDSSNTSEGATSQFLESSAGWCGIMIYLAQGGASVNAVSVEYINHIEYLQQGGTLYGFLDTTPGGYDPQAMAMGAAVDAQAPVGLIENAVETVTDAIGVAGRIVAGGMRVIGAVNRAAQITGIAAQSRGFFRSPPNAPFLPRIEYKEDY